MYIYLRLIFCKNNIWDSAGINFDAEKRDPLLFACSIIQIADNERKHTL